MDTKKIFYSGDVVRHEGETYQCICADNFAAVFGKIKINYEHSTITSYEELFALSNEGPTDSVELLFKEVKETNIPGFRSRDHGEKGKFEYELISRNSFAVSEGAPEIPGLKKEANAAE